MATTSRAGPRHGRARPSDNRQDRDRDSGHDSGHDSGMVTVEAAIALSAFVAVLAMVLTSVSIVLDQIRCTDAAREAARLVARGEQDRAADAVRQIAGGATLSVSSTGDAITATVWDQAASGLLPGVHVRADAYAVREPEAPPEPSAGSTPPPRLSPRPSPRPSLRPTEGVGR